MRVICVAGARPNFMKVQPVIDSLERRDVEVTLVHTGQHYDAGMSEIFFEQLGMKKPDHWLGAGSGSHAQQTARILETLEPIVMNEAPDIVIVAGDVNSTLAGALVGAKSPSLVAHVEAGLRSRDWGMPEEVNRIVADHLGDYLFAPSQEAVDNLHAEGIDEGVIFLVGNVMIDSLLAHRDRAVSQGFLASFGLERGTYGVITLHRPANVDDDEILKGLLDVLGQIAAELPLVFPAHPRVRAALDRLGVPEGITVLEPVGYLEFLAMQEGARVVLTDSGGIQEETTVLGIPCLTLRENTERPTTVVEGTNTIVGRRPDRIMSGFRRAMSGNWKPRRPALWDGHAAERIADVLVGPVPEAITRRHSGAE